MFSWIYTRKKNYLTYNDSSYKYVHKFSSGNFLYFREPNMGDGVDIMQRLRDHHHDHEACAWWYCTTDLSLNRLVLENSIGNKKFSRYIDFPGERGDLGRETLRKFAFSLPCPCRWRAGVGK